MNIYIDCEFDSIRLGRKFQQCIVSIGAVSDSEHGSQEFYELIHPKKFRRVSYVVHKITQLKAEEIMKAPSFAYVMDEFLAWIHEVSKGEVVHLFSFGPDDRRTLNAHARYEYYKGLQKNFDIKDIQKILSSSIKYKNQVISTTLSLDDVKYAYTLQGDVVHNALNDAIDLMQLHQAYEQATSISEEHIQEIWERKESKRKEVEEKQRVRMLKLLEDKYKQYEGVVYPIKFLPDCIEQCILLEQLQHPCQIQYNECSMTYIHKTYLYDQCAMQISWHFENEQPYVNLFFYFNKDAVCFRIELNYRNASILESITRTSEVKMIVKEDCQ